MFETIFTSMHFHSLYTKVIGTYGHEILMSTFDAMCTIHLKIRDSFGYKNQNDLLLGLLLYTRVSMKYLNICLLYFPYNRWKVNA